ncbi:hypothetical protein CYMTET_11302 [Cymbomonas tetramitiformis]|uniref:Peptidase S53 domain-containing protein n=1 Tax=Cymbomonas tetramitiformis TaxID=36881 RepID=A0AAE0LDL5_9CHLO|nr:hypothetical protein CYMTET_11302 [Cymbomonas tetramitiformis]
MQVRSVALLCAVSLAVVDAARLVSDSRRVMEPGVFLEATPSWTQGRRCQDSHTISALIMLKHTPEGRAQLEETFWAVSNPQNPRYGQYLTQDQLTDIIKAPAEALVTVVDWLKSEGVTNFQVSANLDAVNVILPAPKAEKLFDTTFFEFKHSTANQTILRTGKPYTLPTFVANVVDLVADIIRFPAIPSVKIVEEEGVGAWPSDCGSHCKSGWTTPGVLTQRYKLGAAPSTVTSGSTFATAEFQGQLYTEKILNDFASDCNLPNGVKVDHQIGPDSGSFVCNLGACTESLLDIEYIKAVGGAIPLTNVYSSTYSLLDWANTVLNLGDKDMPLVHSVSYGNDEKQQTGAEYMYQVNTAFAKFGARGASILFASGDQGVYGRTGPGQKVFNPDFPGGSPYHTSVGGTDFLTDQIGDEKTWQDGGGGFSNTFGIPSYQAEAVAGYKSSGVELPPADLWNNTGRGYPDVSALAGVKAPYCVRNGPIYAGVGGTSAACPVVAGIFAKLNDVRMSAGKPPLGFLNPFIYQNAAGFNDVTTGKNNANGPYGFEATKGWDAATGMGTPDFEKLAKLVV